MAEKEEFIRTRKFTLSYDPVTHQELFPAIFILDLLFDHDSYFKNELVEFIHNKGTSDGLYSFFEDASLLSPDVDDTALALTSLIRAKRIDPDIVSRAVDRILRNVSPEGIIEVFFVSSGPFKGQIDPVVCANALYLICLEGKDEFAIKTEAYIESMLYSQNYESLYYPSEDMFLYMVSRLVKKFPRLRQKFSKILTEKLLSRIGASETPIDLANRITAANTVGIENEDEMEKLMALRNQDGFWGEDLFFQARKPFAEKIFYCGSREITTAFAIHARNSFYDLRGISKICR